MTSTEATKLTWVGQNPKKAGLYLFRPFGQWVVCLREVEKGKWQYAQNPEELYAGKNEKVSKMQGIWFGPIPQPPTK